MLISISLRNLITCLCAFMVIALVAGCGGGGSSTGQITSVSEAGVVGVTANPGPIVAVRVGDTATLDGSRSSTSSIFDQPMSYAWSFTHKPKASNAQLQGAATANPIFVADAAGVYMVALVASSGGYTSQRQVGTVVATVAPDRFTGPFNHMGLSPNCVNCHDGTIDLVPGTSTIFGKSANHLATSTACQTCHTPQGFATIPYVDHKEIFGNCSECHNGTIAIGKSAFHTPTEAECNSCHNTTHFLQLNPDGSFDHSNISTACTGCHNGTVATGKDVGHIVTDTQCGYCHNILGFLPAYPNHVGPDVVGKRCDSCHGAGQALGQSIGHPNTSPDCAACHSINSFSLGGVFNHGVIDSISQPCAACHNDTNSIGALGKGAAPNHPITNADCGSCHNTTSFFGAFVDHTGPTVVGKRCDSCHGSSAVGTSLNHMPIPTGQDCAACHTPGTFTSGSYDHTGVVSGCNTCHNNVITVGKFVNHLPTNPANQDCADCHNTTEFANTVFDHVGIDTANCKLCHNGDITLGKHLKHVPTTLDCSSCHTTSNFTSFAGIVFNHQGIDPANCSFCHNTGIATPKTVNHIPARDDCSACHNSTAVFTSTTFLTTGHQSITHGCEGCHVSKFLPTRPDLYKFAIHLPTNQDCYLCPTTAGFFPAITPFRHLAITGNCVSCHDGSVNNVAVGARGKTPTAIHQNTSGDCSGWHNTTNFLGAFVDHTGPDVTGKRCDVCHNGIDATGMDAKTNPVHVLTDQDCGTCHLAGGAFTPAIFDHTGIVNNCASCHDGVSATGLSLNHITIGIGQDCSACHNPTAFAGAKFDHTGILNNCGACHNGDAARGKIPPPNHVPTNDDCANCHQTTGFLPATFDHVGIVDNCTSCHGVGFATGKSVNHVTTGEDCGVCHTTNTFVGAVFDHTGIVDNCASCHGSTAIGMHNAHIATNLDCHFCHTTATFKGGTWVHDSSTAGTCDTCHNNNGGGATPKNQGHFNTAEQCDVCHSTNGWAPTVFSHSPNGDYPGDHFKNLSCQKCHGNLIGTPFTWPSPQYAPFCAACHERDFKSEGKHNGGKSGTVAQNKNCGASGCHKVFKRGF